MRPRFLLAPLLAATLIVAGAPSSVAEDLSVKLVQPAEGATVGGSVPVEARTRGTAVSVAFDWSSNDGQTWTQIGTDADGADGWSAAWDTGEFNGPAQVRATATDGAVTVTDTSAVNVDNAAAILSLTASPNPFSPNGNGMKDVTTIVVDAGEAATISVRVLDSTGAVRRSWAPVLTTTGKRTIAYAGRDNQNRALPGGLYTLEATAVDDAGRTTITEIDLRIDLGFPSAAWVNITPDTISNQASMSFVYTAWDRAVYLNIELHLYDRLGPVGAPLLGLVRERGQRTLHWSPRYRDGDLLFPGRYRARVRVEDDAGNVTWTGFRAWRVHRTMTAKVFSRVNGSGNRVALTFDDCYSWTGWDAVLDQLAAHGAKATFFCSGPYVRQFPALARRTRDDGHTVGSHGWDHAYMPGRSLADQQNRMRLDQSAWWDVARETTAPYFRPPYGAYNSTTLLAAGTTSHPRVIMWDVDPSDYATSSSSLIASRVLASVKAGSIVVMHALPQTAGALPAILAGLKNKGLTAATLPRMFREAGYR